MKISLVLKPLISLFFLGFVIATGVAFSKPAAAVELSDAEKKEFMNGCTSGAEGQPSLQPEKARAYCQCTLDGLSSKNVTEVDAKTFIANIATPNQWPESIQQLIITCAENHLIQ